MSQPTPCSVHRRLQPGCITCDQLEAVRALLLESKAPSSNVEFELQLYREREEAVKELVELVLRVGSSWTDTVSAAYAVRNFKLK